MAIGFMVAIQFKQVHNVKDTLPAQRVEELSGRLIQVEEERDELSKQVEILNNELSTSTNDEFISELKFQAGTLAVEGEGIILKMDDSTRAAKSGENPNLYLIHDDDILRVINELRAAGAEAISINGQRLIATSEIRCAGPTLSVNNVRSAAPYEIRAIGEKKSLENSIKMRGGVVDSLKVWGIQLEVTTGDKIYIPPYKGTTKRVYSHAVEEQ
ncbi:MAG: DUF881 domain-containing protein [Selenomonadaceae bacterium]|nr:DUF881 domain-containing protein [Selenomonadaceae bacterium]